MEINAQVECYASSVPHKVHSAVYCTSAIGKLGILHIQNIGILYLVWYALTILQK